MGNIVGYVCITFSVFSKTIAKRPKHEVYEQIWHKVFCVIWVQIAKCCPEMWTVLDTCELQ